MRDQNDLMRDYWGSGVMIISSGLPGGYAVNIATYQEKNLTP